MVAAEAARQRVIPKRITGTLIQWRGKFGWIQPHEAVEHDDAVKKGGKIYLGVEDFESSEKPKVRSTVSFFVYADDSGLGAEKCSLIAGPADNPGSKGAIKPVQKTIQKHQGGAARWPGNSSKGSAMKGAALALAVHRKGPQGGNVYGKGTNGYGKGANGWSKGGANGFAKGGANGYGKGTNGYGKGASKNGKGGSARVVQKGNAGRKGGAKGGDAAARGPAPAPDKTTRERIFPKRVVGKVVRWRGSVGWIKPDEEIDHPDIEKHRGSLYLHEVDIQPGHQVFKGAQVSFFVYLDEDGLGAEHCMLLKDQPALAAQLAPRSRRAVAKVKAKVQSKGQTSEAKKPKLKLGKLAKGEKNKKEKKEKKEKPPRATADLPRTRLTTAAVTGEVLEWKGKFGWIKPAEEIEHEVASKNGGRIYVNAKDVLGEDVTLTTGQTVQFHVYADTSGLGAEECTPSA